ncbi:hypothetical protein GCM10009539_06200 [Cryptosporangium japonicum]|uniref:Uncharacterized protein n=1 Tax=Cryptosporangium japonicum TaxID=80872 RepID=A0ABN0TK74_9ACTN
MSGPHRERGLPDAGHAVDGPDQRRVRRPGGRARPGQPSEFGVPPGEVAGVGRQVVTAGHRRPLRCLGGHVVVQDLLVQQLQPPTRLHPEFVDERPTRGAEHVQGLDLLAGPVEREHQQPDQVLPERIPLEQHQ